nr:hypothetical protein [Tanacetum cinerariifolium]
KNDFALWQVRIKALQEQQGLAAALEELPATTIAAYNTVTSEDDRSKGDVGEGLYVRGKSGMKQDTDSAWQNHREEATDS